jgi:hypothetical protein
MTDTIEAHVQVLTAEVRTLIVGSRQITMSVHDQLDDVAPGRLKPFGRVRPKNTTGRYVRVIGHDTATGALVRSYVPCRPMDLDERGWLYIGAGSRARYAHWDADADAEQQKRDLAKVAARWAALDLIVLAGLR